MTEEEAREIVERYEELAALTVKAAGPFNLPAFEVSFPIEVKGASVVVRENVEGDPWRLRTAVLALE